MIDGLLLNSTARTTSPQTAILAPTPIKFQQQSMLGGISSTPPTMISTSNHSSPPSVTTTSTVSSNSSPTIEWTHERIMNLIKLYEQKSVLWNPSNPEYFHRDIRNMVYDDLVRELNIADLTVNETKRKLENLRSYFRRETKKLQDHERKTSEKLMSRWPYYESLQFIHEFMSVKNETGAEMGFSKNLSRSSAYQLPTMKRESTQEECAMQVPVGSTSNTGVIDTALGSIPTSAFHLASSADLVAVLKALQGPLSETAASCLGISTQDNNLSHNSQSNGSMGTPYHSPDNTASPKSKGGGDECRSETTTPNLLSQSFPPLTKDDSSPKGSASSSVTKKRKLDECLNPARSSEDTDLCGDYGRTVAHQLRQMTNYERDLCRLQIDQLIFNVMHKKKDLSLIKDVDSNCLSPSADT